MPLAPHLAVFARVGFCVGCVMFATGLGLVSAFLERFSGTECAEQCSVMSYNIATFTALLVTSFLRLGDIGVSIKKNLLGAPKEQQPAWKRWLGRVYTLNELFTFALTAWGGLIITHCPSSNFDSCSTVWMIFVGNAMSSAVNLGMFAHRSLAGSSVFLNYIFSTMLPQVLATVRGASHQDDEDRERILPREEGAADKQQTSESNLTSTTRLLSEEEEAARSTRERDPHRDTKDEPVVMLEQTRGSGSGSSDEGDRWHMVRSPDLTVAAGAGGGGAGPNPGRA